jgi:GntR family transcriptional regulator/MocR family aminotransferase
MLRSTGAETRSTFCLLNESSQPVDVLLAVDRGGPGTLGAQIEHQLRRAIRDGKLRPGTQVPSTRDLARQLGISRRVAVDAYAQLAAEGYLLLRQGARPRVSSSAAVAATERSAPLSRDAAVRFDFRPSMPDVSSFPRRAWLRSLRTALTTMTDADLGYGDPLGVEALRTSLADYLGRVRGVVAGAECIAVTCGYSQGLGIVCSVLAERGARRVAVEDPSFPEQRMVVRRAGLEPVPIEVDELGLRVDLLADADVDAVVLTPAHQHPTGVVLAADRRAELVSWLRERDAIAIEDDYDAEYRYDRAAVGALQGLDPERVVYIGSVSKSLVPALRIGWLVVPPPLVDAVRAGKQLADRQTDRIQQHAFADFLARGELDRHLRRQRAEYRRRRDALLAAVARELPRASVSGIAAGLHAIVELHDGEDEAAIVDEARRRGIVLETMNANRAGPARAPATLLLGYGQISEPAIGPGIRAIAEAIGTTYSPPP